MSRNVLAALSHGLLGVGYPLLDADDVRQGVDLGDGTEGTLALPAEADVRQGTGYGAAGAEYAGALVAPASARSGAYPHTVTVERRTLTPDTRGGRSEVWTARLEGVACRVATVGAQWRMTNEQGEPVYTHTVMMDPLELDEQDDRINWGGMILEIVQILPAKDVLGRVRHQTVQAREVRA